MKKLLCCILSLAVAFALAACGTAGEEEKTASEAGSSMPASSAPVSSAPASSAPASSAPASSGATSSEPASSEAASSASASSGAALPEIEGYDVWEYEKDQCKVISYVRSDASSVEIYTSENQENIQVLDYMTKYEQKETTIAGVTVTLGYDGDMYLYARWEKDGQTYGVEDPLGMPESNMMSFLEAFLA